jgi:hypothetical protein
MKNAESINDEIFSQMLYKRNKAPSSRKKKDEGLDDCIVKALQLMQEEQQIVCLVQSPTTRMQELTAIFHSEFPNLHGTMTCTTAPPAVAPAAAPQALALG